MKIRPNGLRAVAAERSTAEDFIVGCGGLRVEFPNGVVIHVSAEKPSVAAAGVAAPPAIDRSTSAPPGFDPRGQWSRKQYHRLTVSPYRDPTSAPPNAPPRAIRGFLRRRQAGSEIATEPRLRELPAPPVTTPADNAIGHTLRLSADRPAGTAGDMGSSDAYWKSAFGAPAAWRIRNAGVPPAPPTLGPGEVNQCCCQGRGK